MKKIIILSILIITMLSVFIYLVIVNSSPNQEEVIPAEELSDLDLRNTIITLYFETVDTGEIQTEARLVDSKKLLDNPYAFLINLLIEGPKNNKLRRNLPEGTKLNTAFLLGNCLVIDFSKEFVDNSKGDALQKSNIIYAIVNTVTELNEVSRVKIIIDGEESEGFSDVGINFREEFVRKN